MSKNPDLQKIKQFVEVLKANLDLKVREPHAKCGLSCRELAAENEHTQLESYLASQMNTQEKQVEEPQAAANSDSVLSGNEKKAQEDLDSDDDEYDELED